MFNGLAIFTEPKDWSTLYEIAQIETRRVVYDRMSKTYREFIGQQLEEDEEMTDIWVVK